MNIAETERLVISKFSMEDAGFYLKLLNTPHWIKYIGDRNVRSIKEAQDYLANGILKSYNELGFGFYKLQLKTNNTIIGTCGIIKRDTLEVPDFGFAFLPNFEGQGFGYEASVAILNFIKVSLSLNKLFAITLPNNTRSISLLEKLGFKYQKRVKPFEDEEELLLFVKHLD
jgi:RimJ/RimL family protein N-acetyltransferase